MRTVSVTGEKPAVKFYEVDVKAAQRIITVLSDYGRMMDDSDISTLAAQVDQGCKKIGLLEAPETKE